MQTLEGHSDWVIAQFSSMAQYRIGELRQDCARVERGDRGVCADIGGHSDWVMSAQFSPDGTNIVSASGDKTVRVRSVATGECVQTLEGHTQRSGVFCAV